MPRRGAPTPRTHSAARRAPSRRRRLRPPRGARSPTTLEQGSSPWWTSAAPSVNGPFGLLPLTGGGALDLDAPPPRLLAQGHRHFQHPVLEFRLRALHVGALGKRDRAGEAAVRTLGAIAAAFLLDLQLGAALALDDQGVVGCLDADVLLLEAGQVGADDELSLTLDHLDRRRPDREATALQPGFSERKPAASLLEQPIHVFHHPADERERAGPERQSEPARRGPPLQSRALLRSGLLRLCGGLSSLDGTGGRGLCCALFGHGSSSPRRRESARCAAPSRRSAKAADVAAGKEVTICESAAIVARVRAAAFVSTRCGLSSWRKSAYKASLLAASRRGFP